MPAKNRGLHGNAPDEAPVELLLIDVINDLEFEGGEALLTRALPMADHLAARRSSPAHRRRTVSCSQPATPVCAMTG